MRKKVLIYSIAFFLLSFGITGCGRVDSNQIEADISEASIGTATDADATETGSFDDIPEKITYEIANSNGSYITVDAEIIVPEAVSYSVYEEKEIEIDDDYLKTLAGNLFDNGEYEQIKPAWMCTQEELAKEQAYIGSLVEKYDSGVETEVYMPDWLWNLKHYYNDISYDDSAVAELTQGKMIYRYMTSYDYSEDTVIEGYDNCTLRGNVNGEEWILYYENYVFDGAEYTHKKNNCLVLASVDPKYTGYTIMSSPDNYLDTTMYGENSSDEEQCRELVYDFADKMGLSDSMKIVCENRMVIMDENHENGRMDGYRMFMIPVNHGVENFFSNIYCLGMVEATDVEAMSAFQEYIAFDVSSEGVSNVFIGEQYVLGECIADNVNMLSFEQVDMMAQEYMQELVDTPSEEQMYYEKIDRIQLAYATVRYEDGYSLVPIWTYYLQYDKEYLYHQAFFSINALDGSVLTGIYSEKYDEMFY